MSGSWTRIGERSRLSPSGLLSVWPPGTNDPLVHAATTRLIRLTRTYCLLISDQGAGACIPGHLQIKLILEVTPLPKEMKFV